ncbi:hypothetical protein M758_10G091300 [Ceratodon purpureus]|uniref:Uncharacterized protein n=1 Tax=Ceratodon purpureus TaxID=3225 RepID=A0A8T0GL48_CERPU|nr:hypothetical protein KC19_10G092900 [Ceratodon purpureus]KAG0603404.1 hypothetical protein M758_10G091300 [Ceratodon purpureus]
MLPTPEKEKLLRQSPRKLSFNNQSNAMSNNQNLKFFLKRTKTSLIDTINSYRQPTKITSLPRTSTRKLHKSITTVKKTSHKENKIKNSRPTHTITTRISQDCILQNCIVTRREQKQKRRDNCRKMISIPLDETSEEPRRTA